MNALLAACLVLPLTADPLAGGAARSCGGHPLDFDGDGRADLAVAAPYDRDRAGSVTVMYGSGVRATLTQGEGAEPGDSFGSALAVGDFDGDECADLAVGVSEEFTGERVPGGDGNGVVQLFRGTTGGLVKGEELRLAKPSSDRFGAALTAGDLDGDGKDELVVGAPSQRSGGSVTVYWMKGRKPYQITQKTSWVRQSAHVTDQWGAALATGDFDGDGKDELVVGAPADSVTQDGQGSVTVLDVRARRSRQLTQSSPGIKGAAEKWDAFGAALATGDFNGDGRADLAIGVPGEGLSANQRAMDYGDGTVDVLYGSRAGLRTGRSEAWSQNTLEGRPRYYDRFGAALAAGDFNGDGRDELAIGVPGERAVQVLAGRAAGGLTREGNLLLKGSGRDFGAALAALPGGGRFRTLERGRPLDGLVVAAPDQGLVLYAPGSRQAGLRLGRIRELAKGTGLYGYAFG
ncbi:FG-GAP and VCBS repeat-containing protein [Actinomadura sp. ATCC 31491]|uniref:FG-GAP and VCBS repeat-containing protein n=1 Tax=Actinomadura luzonensis TaxID=2805427 RepID=A0ABT0G3D2_9ACTN|nr:FG-GAP-like repeat-containing protein [Actinomadura luzonensis]MCK2218913.1 FG-GAP and VCBS repeat-containing protein [Actinomadura luzonensis]